MGLDLEAAVLRQALLSDVHAGQNLDAADHRVLEAADLRRDVRVAQHAVHAVPHDELALERLEVNVAGALADGLDQDFVDQLDDRGVLGHLHVEIGGLDFRFVDDLDAVALGDHGVQHIAADAVERLDHAVDVGFRCEHGLDRQADVGAQLVNRVNAVRIAGCNADALAVAAHGHDVVLVHEAAGDEFEQLLVDVRLGQLDDRHRELVAVLAQHVLLGHVAESHQGLIDTLFRPNRRFSLGELFAADQTLRDKCFTDWHVYATREISNTYRNRLGRATPRPRSYTHGARRRLQWLALGAPRNQRPDRVLPRLRPPV